MWTGDGSAVSCQRSLILAYPPSDKTNVGIFRPQTPFALIRGTDLQVGDNNISVSMKDKDMTTPATVNGVYTKLKSVYEKILVSGTGQITVTSGKDAWYDFKTGEISQGNGLQVSVNDPTGKVTGQGFDLVPTTVNFTPPLSQYNHISFYQDKLLVQNKNILLYYKCTMGNLATYNCFLNKTITLDSTQTWDNHNRFMTYNDLSFTWICNKSDCFAAFYNYQTQNNGLFLLTENKSSLKDAMIANDYQTGIRLIASLTTQITFWIGTTTNFNFSKWAKLDASNVPIQQWCPQNINVCPDSQYIFEVYNDCGGFNQKIMKWNIINQTFQFKTSVTGYTDYQGGQFCPMGDEFIVSSKSQNAPIYSFYT